MSLLIFFATSRNPVHCDQTDSGEPDDLDTLLDRIDEFAPAMQRWVESFDEPQEKITKQLNAVC